MGRTATPAPQETRRGQSGRKAQPGRKAQKANPKRSVAGQQGRRHTPATPPATESGSKAARILAALQQPKGATIADLMQATGWQAHSVRGFLSGTIRKKRGLALTSEAGDQGRVYRIAAGPER